MSMWKVIAGLVVLYVVGFVIFVTNLPVPTAHMRPAQGIVALTGGDERVSAAVNLLENHVGQRLLISGVHPQTTKAELKKLSHGGARFDCCADLGYAAENTRGNAQETANWARTHKFNSLIVVTARYHMPRSLTEFQAAMPGVTLEPYPVQPEDIDLDGWWHDVRALHVLHSEYAKYLASTVRNAVDRQGPALDPDKHGGKAHTASR
jgi:uncharacterized SAM-binding protein YcdF (DUF218 family)